MRQRLVMISNQIIKYYAIVITTVLLVAGGMSAWYINSLNSSIEDLRTKHELVVRGKENCESNRAMLRNEIANQNAAIEAIAIDYQSRLGKWENRETERVYITKWKTKYVDRNTTVEVDYEACKEYQLIGDAIRSNGF